MYDATIDAYNFRKSHSLGDNDCIDCKSLLLRLNIITLYRPLSTEFSGMCIKTKDAMFMLINSENTRARQHFTIAHELYHLFIQSDFKPHICNPGNIKEEEEKRADKFASCLLMPEMGVKLFIPSLELENNSISISTLLKLEQYFGVSHTAMIIRLQEIGVIGKQKKDELESVRIKQIAYQLGFDLSLYDSGNEGVIIGDYGVKAKDLYDRLEISETHYIELMKAIGIDLTEKEDG